MMYNTYFGMGIIWWGILMVMLFWIFVLPYRIPFQRYKKDLPLDILHKRFASGEITSEEYQEKKTIIENSYFK